MDGNKKEMSFRLNTAGPKSYDMFLMRFEEEGIEVHFANSNEEDGNTVVTVEDIIKIPKEQMLRFATTYFEALTDYENKFNNGYGLKIPPPKKKGK